MRSVVLTCALAGIAAFSTACATTPRAADTADFAAEVARKHSLDAAELRELLSQAELKQDIIEAMMKPAEKLSWARYRPIFLKPDRIDEGVRFWNENAELLGRLAGEYGVPEEIMVAIVGVETFYGRFKGKHRVLDALYTLGFHYPPRADFFRSELEHYLLLAREEKIDPLAATGSYAGAMGMPQFIPSSYRHYAVDGDGDGRRDLFGSKADILASVANYFQRHGWRQSDPVVFAAQVEGERWRELVNNDLKPSVPVQDLRAAGVRTRETLPSEGMAKLLVLEGEAGEEHYVALNNFYVITRYNRSPLYAMAVYQLSQAIRAKRGAAG